MRRVIVLGHELPTTPDFSLDDLPGSAGRLDVLCRCVTAGLLTSHGIRSNTEVIVVVQDELVIRFAGDEVRRLQPDERSTAARFRDALDAADEAIGSIVVDVSPGVTVQRGDLETAVAGAPGRLVRLHGDGTALPETDLGEPATFVLSDHRSFTDSDDRILEAAGAESVSVGPLAIHADQAITVAHNFLDTDGYRHY